MVFEITNKVALVTGGCSGIGLYHVKELLKNSVKGITIADIDENRANLEDITKEFGENKVIFVKTDVSNKESFENAFKKTIEVFKHIDILINNAGIANDKIWEKEIDINLKGTINGVYLGMENYLRYFKSGSEAVILNTSSIAGLRGSVALPVYTATKYAVFGMTSSWGDPYHYERTKVRIVAVCPGLTDGTDIFNRGEYTFSPEYEAAWPESLEKLYSDTTYCQKPEHLAKEVIRIIKFAENGSSYVVESGLPAYRYIMALKETMVNNILQEN